MNFPLILGHRVSPMGCLHLSAPHTKAKAAAGWADRVLGHVCTVFPVARVGEVRATLDLDMSVGENV